jgi:hypothetical protein
MVLMALRFWLAIFVSSCLLFLVEPMCGKKVLPLLGGTPAAWNTCMVFFQVGLLLGYAYAHAVPDRLGVGRHALLHLLILACAAWTLPISLPDTVPSDWHPVVWLLGALTWGVALPFILVSASTPLVQRWYATLHPAANPYFLYAASNLGSFVALASYPLLVEPSLSLSAQSWWWLGGYLLLLVLTAFCCPWPALDISKSATVPRPAKSPPPCWPRRLRWIMLALVPSSLMLSVTTYLTTDIAPVPLLWVIPIGLYLLTFVLAFAGRKLVAPGFVRRWVPLAVLVAIVARLLEASDPLLLVLAVHLCAFVWVALACHGELARDAPPANHLTDFYLCLALGGALGGAFNGLLAPLVFTRLTEYPLMLVLAALLCGLTEASRPSRADLVRSAALGGLTVLLIVVVQDAGVVPVPAGQFSVALIFALPLVLAYTGHDRPWRYAFSLSAILLAGTLYHGIFGTPVFRGRSYFGVHLVADRDGLRRLVHGGTVHGMESRKPGAKGIPLTYYSPAGPIGQLIAALAGDARLERVGLVGLGAGSLAAYVEPGQHWTFYEIDPSVIHIARDTGLFTFLPQARGTVDIVEGDGRLQLEAAPDRFGMLVLDAFGSDAIPLHLLTREALESYRLHLRGHGLITFHISNNYLDLEPVLANLAHDASPPMACYIADDRVIGGHRAAGTMPSIWAVLASAPEDVPEALRAGRWRPARPRPDLPVWTDDYSNLWHVFRWRGIAE